MKYKKFGKTGIEVSKLCLGTMVFASDFNLDGCREIVNLCKEHGVNFIDTAETYQDSEETLGKILSEMNREEFFVATKCFTPRAYDGKAHRNSRANIIHSIDRSLKLLRTDYVDLYQLHHPDPETPIEETMGVLNEQVEKGKVRYLGCSNHFAYQVCNMNHVAEKNGWQKMVSIQSRYNLLDRLLEVEQKPYMESFDIALMAYSPLCFSMLSGRFKRGEAPPANCRIDNEPMLVYHNDPKVHDTLEGMQDIAASYGVSIPQLAYLWLMKKSYVNTVILGGSKLEHFRSLLEIADKEISDADEQSLDELSAPHMYRPYKNQRWPLVRS